MNTLVICLITISGILSGSNAFLEYKEGEKRRSIIDCVTSGLCILSTILMVC